MDFDRLDAILKERRISRRKLAISTGINTNTMATAFKRKSGLSTDDCIRIAQYLDVDFYYLEGRQIDTIREVSRMAEHERIVDKDKLFIETEQEMWPEIFAKPRSDEYIDRVTLTHVISNVDIPEGVTERQFFIVLNRVAETLDRFPWFRLPESVRRESDCRGCTKRGKRMSECRLFGFEYQDVEFVYNMLDTLYADGQNDLISEDLNKALAWALVILDEVHSAMKNGNEMAFEPIQYDDDGQIRMEVEQDG